jgi:cell wall-associated NlpC family hydrolase
VGPVTRPIRAACALVALASLATSLPAGADPVADKRAEAARIAEELERQGTHISILAEEVNNARLKAAEVEAAAAAASAEAARAEQQVQQAEARLRLQAVNAYVRGGSLPAVQLLISGTRDDLGIRQSYVKAVMGQEREALDELRRARQERQQKQASLDEAQRAAREALATVEARRRQAAAAAAAQRATLGRVQGELAALVEADRRRREEEAARRAREEVARRQAEEERRRRAAPSPAPTTTSPGSPPPARPPSAGAAAAVEEAKRQVGKPYEWGAAGPDSFDCSGLTQWAWKAGGRSLPHSSQAQYRATSRVAVSEIQPGDLTFYGSPIHHVGIYVGNGQMIDAPETGRNVRYASIFRSDLVGVGRVG